MMDGFAAPWCVAGGWAIDLFLGRITRAHDDIELAIFRQDQSLLRRHLNGWTFDKVVNGRREAWVANEELTLPVHEIHARASHDPALAMEILLNERDEHQWLFRRNQTIRMPLERAIVRSDSGMPVLCPAIVLLFKAKLRRAKDEMDFEAARPALDRDNRVWLAAALRACHPGHAWLDRL